MIILDTNVISEGFKPKPDPAVLNWLNEHARRGFFLCAPVLAELRYGIERLPPGARRNGLDRLVANAVTSLFAGDILPFDRSSAHEFGRVFAKRQKVGRPMAPMDALIAAIAVANGMSIATRDIDGFVGLDIELINPFEASSPR